MLDLQFFGLNLHFAVNLLAALVCFSVFWLIFDAWTLRHDHKEAFKWGGFLALSLGFMLHATAAQTSISQVSRLILAASTYLRLAGYLAIIIGQLLDPLQKRPTLIDPFAPARPVPPPAPSEPAPAAKSKPRRLGQFWAVGSAPNLFLPLAALTVGVLYWRRATTGLERHLKPVAWGFAWLMLFELLSDSTLLASTTNPTLYQLIQTYGAVWWATLGSLLVAAIILGRWVWRYLTKRLQSQLFIILVSETLALFLFSTVGFTFLLLQNVQNQSLGDLSTASRVLQYAVASRQAETAAQAEAVSASSAVAQSLAAHDHAALAAKLGGYVAAHNLTTLAILDASGQVLLRGEDPDRFGDSRSSDPLVRRGLVGETSSSVVVTAGVLAPTVTLVAASPIRDATGTIVGVAVAGRAITGAFVDGVRASTGLDSAVYGGNVRAATTLTAPGSADRAIGIKETTLAATQAVLEQNHSFTGVASFQNRDYLAAFTPLRDINNRPVGMLLVARPKDALYAAANNSIQLTFLFVVILTFVCIYPVYRISRFLSLQLK